MATARPAAADLSLREHDETREPHRPGRTVAATGKVASRRSEKQQKHKSMSTASHQLTDPLNNDPKDEFFYVIHPLDDLPEEKVKSDHLPPLKMTPSVRWSLFILRAYLIVMMLLLVYHVVDLARHVWR